MILKELLKKRITTNMKFKRSNNIRITLISNMMI